MVTSVT
ncbi:hypothetical protein ECFRIK2001_3598, partial [Escherichia coli FRIK2001]